MPGIELYKFCSGGGDGEPFVFRYGTSCQYHLSLSRAGGGRSGEYVGIYHYFEQEDTGELVSILLRESEVWIGAERLPEGERFFLFFA